MIAAPAYNCASATERPDSVEVTAGMALEVKAWHQSTNSFLFAERPRSGTHRFRFVDQWCRTGGGEPLELLLETEGRWVRVYFRPGVSRMVQYFRGGAWYVPTLSSGAYGSPSFRQRAADSIRVADEARHREALRAQARADSALRADSIAVVARLRRAGYTPNTIRMILRGEIAIGWTAAAVRESWGEPGRINRTITRAGTQEQWVYRNAYVYVDNGRVTAIQESQ